MRHQGTNPPSNTTGRQQPAARSTNVVRTQSAVLTPTKVNEPFTVVFRSPYTTMVCWLLQTFTAISSLTLFTYGTVIMASMTLIPSSDALRILIGFSVSAGVARLFGSWVASPSSMVSRVLLVDVPPGYMGDLNTLLVERVRARI